MKKRFGAFIFAALAALSISSCSLLPTLPILPSSEQLSSSSNTPDSGYYTVFFDSNGGSEVAPQQVKAGESAKRPSNPTKSGFVFSDWYYEGQPWRFSNRIFQDTTLVAEWTTEEVGKTYVATFRNEDDSFIYSQSGIKAGERFYYDGPTPTKPESLKEPGFDYVFNGWDKDLIIFDNTTFYATYYAIPNGSTTPTQDDWMIETHVDAVDDCVGYNILKNVSSGRSERKLEINFIEGALSDNAAFKQETLYTSYGFAKLNRNQDYITYKFNLNGYTSGTAYFYAMMDSWQSTQMYGYYGRVGQNGDPNFSLNVNNAQVDFSHMKDVPYSDMLSTGDAIIDNGSYSFANECEVGDVTLVNGLNTITYTRLASYNLYIQKIVIYLGTASHVHTFDRSVRVFDEEGHWYPATCGHTVKGDYQPHELFIDEANSKTPTCTAGGYRLLKCMHCGFEKYEELPITHTFGSSTLITGNNGQVNYKLSSCLKCHIKRIEIASMDGTLNGDSTIKSGTPEGFLKLYRNGNSISYQFNYGSYGVGKIYFRAMMDTWNSTSNYSSSYFTGANYDGNFAITFNNALVDYEYMRNTTYLDFFGPELSTEYSNYSLIKECEVGYVQLEPGLNTFTFERVSSYNLTIKDFVILFEDTNNPHFHNSDGEWLMDEYYHWHICKDDQTRYDRAEHAFDQITSETHATCTTDGYTEYCCVICGHKKNVLTEYATGHHYVKDENRSVDPTHDSDGTLVEVCSECGDTRITTIPRGHNWVKEEVTTNSAGKTLNNYFCSVCNKIMRGINFDDYTSIDGSMSIGKMTAGTILKWNLGTIPAGKYHLMIPLYISSEPNLDSGSFNPTLYTIKVNGVEQVISLSAYNSYRDMGVGVGSENAKHFEFCTINLSSIYNDLEIEFTSNVSSYRLNFVGEMRLVQD